MAVLRSLFSSRVRILIIALFFAFFAGMGESDAGYVAGISPQGASENVIIDITGAGFNAIASKNLVVFTHEGLSKENPAVIISSAGAGGENGLARLGVAVPEGLPPGTALVRVVNTVTGETIEGGSIEVIGITLADTAWAHPGSSVDIRISGTPNVRFVAGGTVTAFGEGVKVNYETVESDTSIVANITVSPDARAGSRSIGLMTEAQVAVLLRAFTVKEGPVRLADSGDAPGSLLDDSGTISYIFAPFDEDRSGPSAAPSIAPAGELKPAELNDRTADVGKVADGVRHDETVKADEGEMSQLSPAQPQETPEDAIKPVKTSTAAKLENVNLVASSGTDADKGPFVITLKNGEFHVSIVASHAGVPSVAALKSGEEGGTGALKITDGPAEKGPDESVLRPGEMEIVVKELPKDLPAADIVPPDPQSNDEEEEGVLKKVMVAFLGPFILIGYLLSNLFRW